MSPDAQAPALDTPLFAAANAAPYVAAAVLWVLRDRPWWQRVPAALASLLLVSILAPVGAVWRSREGWLTYLVGFAVLGGLTWIALGLFWLARQFWTGRLGSRLPDEVYGFTGPVKKHGFPAAFAYFGFVVGGIPWMWPLSELAHSDFPVFVLIGAWAVGFVVMAFMRVSEHPPMILVPPYLRHAQPSWRRSGFLPELATVTVLFLAVVALSFWLVDGLHLGGDWIKGGILLAWTLIAALGARRWSGRRPRETPTAAEPPARPPSG